MRAVLIRDGKKKKEFTVPTYLTAACQSDIFNFVDWLHRVGNDPRNTIIITKNPLEERFNITEAGLVELSCETPEGQ